MTNPDVPYWSDEWLTVYQGDCREVMRSLEPESVHCVVTSPPYWGLRDYGTPGQLGLEPTPEEYVANMVDVFREVRRVLRADGTVWLNLGDTYATDRGGTPQPAETLAGGSHGVGPAEAHRGRGNGYSPARDAKKLGLKGKDLVGIPWRVAFALQADGWYLRSDIIWAKPNPMPESVTDRPTKSHEYLFLLSKRPTYYFDQDAVRESVTDSTVQRLSQPGLPDQEGSWRVPGKTNGAMKAVGDPAGRNLRSVWTIATQPYPGAHFATFPAKLVEPCVKAGTSERGVCPECGAPWVRRVERSNTEPQRVGEWKATGEDHRNDIDRKGGFYTVTTSTGWRPSCGHVPGTGSGAVSTGDQPGTLEAQPRRGSTEVYPIPATVLDPFAGSGTTGLVAQSLGRRAILIDLSTDYMAQIMRRNAQMPLPA